MAVDSGLRGVLNFHTTAPGAAVRAFSLMAVFWGLGSVVKPVGAFYGGVGCLYMVSVRLRGLERVLVVFGG